MQNLRMLRFGCSLKVVFFNFEDRSADKPMYPKISVGVFHGVLEVPAKSPSLLYLSVAVQATQN